MSDKNLNYSCKTQLYLSFQEIELLGACFLRYCVFPPWRILRSMIMNTKNYKHDMNKKRKKNYRSVAFKSRPCLSDEGASLDGFSVMQIIFSFLSTAAINFLFRCSLSFGRGCPPAGGRVRSFVYFFWL